MIIPMVYFPGPDCFCTSKQYRVCFCESGMREWFPYENKFAPRDMVLSSEPFDGGRKYELDKPGNVLTIEGTPIAIGHGELWNIPTSGFMDVVEGVLVERKRGPDRKKGCRYLGEKVGLRDCLTCPGRTKIAEFVCDHPDVEGNTTIRKIVEGVPNVCYSCDYFRN